VTWSAGKAKYNGTSPMSLQAYERERLQAYEKQIPMDPTQ